MLAIQSCRFPVVLLLLLGALYAPPGGNAHTTPPNPNPLDALVKVCPSVIRATTTRAPVRFRVVLKRAITFPVTVTLSSPDFDFSSCQLEFTPLNWNRVQYVKATFRKELPAGSKRLFEIHAKPSHTALQQCGAATVAQVDLIDANADGCYVWAGPFVQPILRKQDTLPAPRDPSDTPTIITSPWWYRLDHEAPQANLTSFYVWETDEVMIQLKGRRTLERNGPIPKGYWLTQMHVCYTKICYSFRVDELQTFREQLYPRGVPPEFQIVHENRLVMMPNFNDEGVNPWLDKDRTEESLAHPCNKFRGGAFTLVLPDGTSILVWSKFFQKVIQLVQVRFPQKGGNTYDGGVCTLLRDGSGVPSQVEARYVHPLQDIDKLGPNIASIHVQQGNKACGSPQCSPSSSSVLPTLTVIVTSVKTQTTTTTERVTQTETTLERSTITDVQKRTETLVVPSVQTSVTTATETTLVPKTVTTETTTTQTFVIPTVSTKLEMLTKVTTSTSLKVVPTTTTVRTETTKTHHVLVPSVDTQTTVQTLVVPTVSTQLTTWTEWMRKWTTVVKVEISTSTSVVATVATQTLSTTAVLVVPTVVTERTTQTVQMTSLTTATTVETRTSTVAPITDTQTQWTTQTLTAVTTQLTTSTAQVTTTRITATTKTSVVSTVVTFTKTVSPAPEPTTCIDFGIANRFNVLVRDSYQGSSDVQGRLAAGKDVQFQGGFSIGDMLSNIAVCKEDTLVVGGSLFGWPSGRNYYGNVVVGIAYRDLGQVLDPGCTIRVQPNVLDFAGTHKFLEDMSARLGKLRNTFMSDQVSVENQALTLTYSGERKMEVFRVDNPRYFSDIVNHILHVSNPTKKRVVLVINIFGKNAVLRGNHEALAGLPVIYNFPEATSLDIRGIAVRGYVLAPFAKILDATGVIWGNVYARAMSGSIQVNVGVDPSLPGDCTDIPTSSVASTTTNFPTSTGTCFPNPAVPTVDFGGAGKFNVFVPGVYRGSSDIQGRLAAGGDVSLAAGFSLADQLTNIGSCKEDTLVTEGSLLQWPSGRNYYGNMVVGGTYSNMGKVLDDGCTIRVEKNVLNFTAIQRHLEALSMHLSTFNSTMVVSGFKDQALSWSVNGSLPVEVFNVAHPRTYMDEVTEILPVQNLARNRTTVLILNIFGKKAALRGNHEGLKGLPVVYNFPEATELEIGGISVRGYVLAPFADIRNATGLVVGNVYARSLTGPMQVNLGVDPCVTPPPICVTSPRSNTTNNATNGTTPIVPGSKSGASKRDGTVHALLAAFAASIFLFL